MKIENKESITITYAKDLIERLENYLENPESRHTIREINSIKNEIKFWSCYIRGIRTLPHYNRSTISRQEENVTRFSNFDSVQEDLIKHKSNLELLIY